MKNLKITTLALLVASSAFASTNPRARIETQPASEAPRSNTARGSTPPVSGIPESSNIPADVQNTIEEARGQSARCSGKILSGSPQFVKDFNRAVSQKEWNVAQVCGTLASQMDSLLNKQATGTEEPVTEVISKALRCAQSEGLSRCAEFVRGTRVFRASGCSDATGIACVEQMSVAAFIEKNGATQVAAVPLVVGAATVLGGAGLLSLWVAQQIGEGLIGAAQALPRAQENLRRELTSPRTPTRTEGGTR